jgi:hypothetical protein
MDERDDGAMSEIDIPQTARKMIALYGTDAELVAAGRAEAYADCGDIQASLDWENVATVIAQTQRLTPYGAARR